MQSNKDLAINEINKEFEKLSNLVLSQLDKIAEVLNQYDENFSDEVVTELIKTEKKINKLELKLDGQIVKTIALYKPVASEIRQLFAMYRMIINLERIGDLAIKVINIILEIRDQELIKQLSPTLHHMLQLATEMVNNALISFANNDEESAFWTIKKDEDIDILNQKLLRRSIKRSGLSKDVQAELFNITDLRSIVSSIERIGDHATNIAETTIYAILGKSIRHQTIDSKEVSHKENQQNDKE